MQNMFGRDRPTTCSGSACIQVASLDMWFQHRRNIAAE